MVDLYLYSTLWAFVACSRVNFSFTFTYGPDSSVGIAIGYEPDGPGIESQWEGEIIRTCPYRPWGLPILLYNGYRVFPGSKAAVAWH